MVTLTDKVKEEKEICRLLLSKLHEDRCYNLIVAYQKKYKRPFPISVIDAYLEETR